MLRYHKKTLLALVFLVFLSGCAASRTAQQGEVYDPLEKVNRAVFAFNDALDAVLLKPTAELYRFVFPDPVEKAVQSFLRNLRSPITVANQLLQGDLKGAGQATGRFVLNSTVGLAGLIDVAEKYDLPYEREDFGQTLAVWGVGPGPYLVLPILGPSTLRATTGLGIDILADPVRVQAHHNDADEFTVGRFVAQIIDKRAHLLDTLDEIERSSIDYYAALRSMYLQKRESDISDGNTTYPDFKDFDEE